MQDNAVVVLITVPDIDVGRQIARALVDTKLAACVNILPEIESIYRWEGDVIQERELLLLVKTWGDLVEDKLISAVREIHPYTVPEIIVLPVISGFDRYLMWIEEMTA